MTQLADTTLNDNQPNVSNPLAPGAGALAASSNIVPPVAEAANIVDPTPPTVANAAPKKMEEVLQKEEPVAAGKPVEAGKPAPVQAEQPAPEPAPEEPFRYTLPPLENIEQIAEQSSAALRGQFNWENFKQQLIENVKARNADPKHKDNPVYNVTQQRFFYHLLGDSSVRQLLHDRNIDATTIDKAREALARSEVAHNADKDRWAEVVPMQLNADGIMEKAEKKEEKKREVKVPSFFDEYVAYAQEKAAKAEGVVTKHDLFEGALMSERGFGGFISVTGAHEILDDYGINAETVFPGPYKLREDKQRSRMGEEVKKVMDTTIKPILDEQSEKSQRRMEQLIEKSTEKLGDAFQKGVSDGIKDAMPAYLLEALTAGSQAPSHQEREMQKQQAAAIPGNYLG